jgi:hypothetical protein
MSATTKDEGISNFEFNVTDTFENVLEMMAEEQKALLGKPSGLTQVILCSNWRDKKYRKVDFTGTTNEEAIKKILTFYKHKTYRRLIGDHTFFGGIDRLSEGESIVSLKSTMEDVAEMTCARCRCRVGSHTFREAWKHGLVTKEEYIKFYEDETERLEAEKNAK